MVVVQVIASIGATVTVASEPLTLTLPFRSNTI
jgi:hypothetical protein